MGSSGMGRQGRKHLRKVSGRSARGGGVTHFDTTPWGPMNVLDGGRDAPSPATSRRKTLALWGVAASVAVAILVVVLVNL